MCLFWNSYILFAKSNLRISLIVIWHHCIISSENIWKINMNRAEWKAVVDAAAGQCHLMNTTDAARCHLMDNADAAKVIIRIL